jgi:serine/threonine protein kinase
MSTTCGKISTTLLGTLDFISPEVLANPRSFDERSEVWSLGVTLFELLTGELPFDGFNGEEFTDECIKKDIMNCNFEIPEEVSADAADLVLKLLQQNPDDRLTLSEILEHPFITKNLTI